MAAVHRIAPSNAFPERFQAYNGTTIGVTKHAILRAEQRGIDLAERLNSLRGVLLRDYKRHGVIARWQAYHRRLAIITVF